MPDDDSSVTPFSAAALTGLAVDDATSPDARRERMASLIEAVAQRQDRAAFAELFAFFAPRVKAYLMRLGAGDGLAEDVAQDVMVSLWRKAHLFDRRQAAASTWIFRIARNRRIDIARREQRPALDPEEEGLRPAEAPAPDADMDIAQRDDLVRAALADLPPEQAALVSLAFYEGLSHVEIAERAALPLGTVKSRIRLAFAKLRARLEGAR